MPGIIGTLPAILQNGTTADASQVMSDLNFIVNQVNANAQPVGAYAVTGSAASFASVAVTGAAGLTLGLLVSPNVAPLRFGDGSGWTLRFQTSSGGTTFATLTDTGAFTTTGAISGSNITGTSDERLKEDWEAFPPDFLERVASVRHGTYTRKDTGERRVGAGAQSLQKVLPEAVFGDERLAIAEGSAALAIVIELASEVLRLRALLEPVK
ncbi:tail fiber domain-containing protein [Burkholderia vietnamiensis]|uniref:tail fiber domain-containing protein n=1 Tax=Burkholderia vietnamiensis TaxID=60552 RepID=UPI00265281E7|nr:tail fiber domain-containing protein [Burkholderia vietnamiensis]MDN8066208.1 tail fiber domain-containing protein [Burkholderia vietnamiensis]